MCKGPIRYSLFFRLRQFTALAHFNTFWLVCFCAATILLVCNTFPNWQWIVRAGKTLEPVLQTVSGLFATGSEISFCLLCCPHSGQITLFPVSSQHPTSLFSRAKWPLLSLRYHLFEITVLFASANVENMDGIKRIGCSQFCRQFSALVRKNALVKRRAWCQLVSEKTKHIVSGPDLDSSTHLSGGRGCLTFSIVSCAVRTSTSTIFEFDLNLNSHTSLSQRSLLYT